MSGSQKAIFLNGEGDGWFVRNKDGLAGREAGDDPVLGLLAGMELGGKAILEVGCADGWRLRKLEAMGAMCSGVDPSAQAIEAGGACAPKQVLKVGTADALAFADQSFDVVIYGFCLYLCDRADLFRIAAEGDRVLREGGLLVIYDFCTDTAYRNPYSHSAGMYSYKMRYGDLFSWNPAYAMVHHELVHGGDAMDERVGITVLRKQLREAYPDNPYR